ncbi:MAG: hypothetical protein K0Q43_629 [Ramlibacter sp.]|nr:hypothetical protein [Ramlibacter sp.]
MGIAFFTFGGMFSPLHSLMGWLGHRPRHAEALPQARHVPKHLQAARARAVRPSAPARPCEKARRPLRVVRVLDTSAATASAGRMFMSGCMADVCAELDRLAALEATAG